MWYDIPQDLNQDIVRFAHHCAFMRSIYSHLKELFEYSDGEEKNRMKRTAPILFSDLNHILIEYVILQVCKVTDPVKQGANENQTAAFMLKHYDFQNEPQSLQRLIELCDRLKAFRQKVLPARNKLISHADREAIRAGVLLGKAPNEDWEKFWDHLQEFVTIIHEKVVGHPFPFETGSDANGLLKALKYSECFEVLLRDNDQTVAKRARDLALAFA